MNSFFLENTRNLAGNQELTRLELRGIAYQVVLALRFGCPWLGALGIEVIEGLIRRRVWPSPPTQP
jgi:hypothetical protein